MERCINNIIKLYVGDCFKLPLLNFKQDSYALCRVFKKNVMCTEVEEQGQCSLAMVEIRSQVVSRAVDYETASPGDMPVGSSSCIDEDDKDDAWMQFITDDAWCSNITSSECGEQEPSNTVALVN